MQTRMGLKWLPEIWRTDQETDAPEDRYMALMCSRRAKVHLEMATVMNFNCHFHHVKILAIIVKS